MVSSHFAPRDCAFCLAKVNEGSETSKTQLLMSWFSFWMQFQKRCDNKGIVVFDIDDTLVDNKEQRIEPVAAAYRACLEMGFHCAIVTARPESSENRKETVAMLRENEIDGWESLYMMPSSVQTFDAEHISKYKRSARDDIETRYRIVGNVGDMWHDLVRFPLVGTLRVLGEMGHDECGVFFPPMSHGEVAVKLVGHLD